MLSFSTDFPLKDCSAEEFANCVSGWIEKMPLGSIDGESIKSLMNGTAERVTSGRHTLLKTQFVNDNLEALGFRHIVTDGGVTYSTEVVFSKSDGDCWVGIRNDRISEDVNFHLRESKKPQIIKALLENVGGGLDGELYVKDAAHYLKDGDETVAVRLMNGDSANLLPIIYVSRDRYDDLPINVAALARMAGGLAHVVVEPSRKFSLNIQADTGGRNAYGGTLGVYMPNGERWLIFGDNRSEHDVRLETVERVRRSLLHRAPRKLGDWQNIQAMVGRERIQKLRESGSTDLDAFVTAFDQENETLKAQRDAALEELATLRAKVSEKRREREEPSPFLKSQDYFPNEGREFIRDALKSALPNLPDKSRRAEKVIEAIEALGITEEAQRRREALKSTLNKADSLDDAFDVLRELGFSKISEKNHYKLEYNSDPKYSFTSAKTAGDFRSLKNLGSDIAKIVF